MREEQGVATRPEGLRSSTETVRVVNNFTDQSWIGPATKISYNPKVGKIFLINTKDWNAIRKQYGAHYLIKV
jgi:hypothetical protein